MDYNHPVQLSKHILQIVLEVWDMYHVWLTADAGLLIKLRLAMMETSTTATVYVMWIMHLHISWSEAQIPKYLKWHMVLDSKPI